LLPLLENGYDMRAVEEPLGHKAVQTTPDYTHVLNRGERGVHGPLDRLWKRVCGETLGVMSPGPYRTVEEARGMERKWLHGKHLSPQPAGGGFVLG
jgi:hypothetical protein